MTAWRDRLDTVVHGALLQKLLVHCFTKRFRGNVARNCVRIYGHAVMPLIARRHEALWAAVEAARVAAACVTAARPGEIGSIAPTRLAVPASGH